MWSFVSSLSFLVSLHCRLWGLQAIVSPGSPPKQARTWLRTPASSAGTNKSSSVAPSHLPSGSTSQSPMTRISWQEMTSMVVEWASRLQSSTSQSPNITTARPDMTSAVSAWSTRYSENKDWSHVGLTILYDQVATWFLGNPIAIADIHWHKELSWHYSVLYWVICSTFQELHKRLHFISLWSPGCYHYVRCLGMGLWLWFWFRWHYKCDLLWILMSYEILKQPLFLVCRRDGSRWLAS